MKCPSKSCFTFNQENFTPVRICFIQTFLQRLRQISHMSRHFHRNASKRLEFTLNYTCVRTHLILNCNRFTRVLVNKTFELVKKTFMKSGQRNLQRIIRIMEEHLCTRQGGLHKKCKKNILSNLVKHTCLNLKNMTVWCFCTACDYLSVIACVRHIDIIPVTYIDPNEWPLYRDYICNLRKSFMFYLSSQAGSILTQVSQIKVLWSRYESTVFQLTAAPPVADEKYIDNDIYWQHSAFKEVLNLGGMTSCQL